MAAISNLGYGASPVSNPLTVERDAFLAGTKAFRKAPQSELKVPDPDMSFYSNFLGWQNSLHVPETAPAPRATNLDFRSYGKQWNDKEIMSMPTSQQDLKWDAEVKKKSKELE